MTVTREAFFKSIDALEKALSAPKNDLTRDASIQRFEFCVELAWKTCKKVMGTATTAPKDVIREMAQNSYIQEVDIWLLAIDHRNLSSHTYNEALAERVYEFAKLFIIHAKRLRELLKTP